MIAELPVYRLKGWLGLVVIRPSVSGPTLLNVRREDD